MGDNTKIEWSDATWNCVTGCDRVSDGCSRCYAMTLAPRLKAMGNPRYQNDGDPRTSGPGFGVTLHHDLLDLPLRWKRPRRVFVNSMSDLFHEQVPMVFQAQVFATMAKCPQHTFQVLTKRPQRMARMVGDWAYQFRNQMGVFGGCRGSEYPLPNVHLGTSIESDRYTFRADHLRATPAAVRFVSLEPLLGPLPSLDLTDIDWVIVGGESGRKARPMHVGWVRDLRDRAVAAGVPFFFKQWGEWSWPAHPGDHALTIDGRLFEPGARLGMDHMMRPTFVRRTGKKVAGRTLDGRTWDEYPAVPAL